jgi:hypothetical protein
MDSLTEAIATINETTLKAIGSFQEQVLAFNRDLAAVVGKASELPSWVPTPEPLTDVKVDDLVKQVYNFQAQRVEADKNFALGLVDIWAPAARKSASASASATKATASKS